MDATEEAGRAGIYIQSKYSLAESYQSVSLAIGANIQIGQGSRRMQRKASVYIRERNQGACLATQDVCFLLLDITYLTPLPKMSYGRPRET